MALNFLQARFRSAFPNSNSTTATPQPTPTDTETSTTIDTMTTVHTQEGDGGDAPPPRISAVRCEHDLPQTSATPARWCPKCAKDLINARFLHEAQWTALPGDEEEEHRVAPPAPPPSQREAHANYLEHRRTAKEFRDIRLRKYLGLSNTSEERYKRVRTRYAQASARTFEYNYPSTSDEAPREKRVTFAEEVTEHASRRRGEFNRYREEYASGRHSPSLGVSFEDTGMHWSHEWVVGEREPQPVAVVEEADQDAEDAMWNELYEAVRLADEADEDDEEVVFVGRRHMGR